MAWEGYECLFCLAVRKLHVRGMAIFWGQGWWLSVGSQHQTWELWSGVPAAEVGV